MSLFKFPALKKEVNNASINGFGILFRTWKIPNIKMDN